VEASHPYDFALAVGKAGELARLGKNERPWLYTSSASAPGTTKTSKDSRRTESTAARGSGGDAI
jgi:hypothetical protein